MSDIDPVTVVRSMCDDAARDGSTSAFLKWLHPDCTIEYSGAPTLRGRDAIIALDKASAKVHEWDKWVVEYRNIAATGDTVLLERYDRLYKDGKEVIVIPVMGSLRVLDGQVIEWRDYFDAAAAPMLDPQDRP